MLTGIEIIVFLVLASLTAYSVVTDVFNRVQYAQLGQSEDRFDRSGERWGLVFSQVLGQAKVLKDPVSGIMHFFIFWGFITLALGTLNFIVEGLLHTPIPFIGDAAWYNFLKDLACGLVIIGVLGSIYRRTVGKIPRIENSIEAFLILGFILTLMVTEILFHGVQFALGQGREIMDAAFLAAAVTPWFEGLPKVTLEAWYKVLWWIHVLTLFCFAYLVPKSKHLHLVFAPFNVYFTDLGNKGTLKKIDFEDESLESYGVSQVQEYNWKQLFDTFSCVECGRCTDNCPAYQTGKPLSPKRIHVDIRHHLEDKGPILLRHKKAQAAALAGAVGAGADAKGVAETAATVEVQAANEAEQAILDKSLIDDIITEDVLWACTTCRNCMHVCPVNNEHISKLVDLRRYLVLTEGRVSEECQRTFNNIENQGNPWGLSRNGRGDWAKELGVPTLAQKPDVEYLVYVGCAGSFDDRNIKTSKSLVKVLQAAGVDFAIMGGEEWCCGETTRRMGNEYLFQTIVERNVEAFNSNGIKKVITACPHCFNTLKNEYPEFGAAFEQVIHHGDFLADLIHSGKLKLSNPQALSVTVHDSCYLGRYNEVYEGPRTVLKAAGVAIKEMPRNMDGSFCCGAGGGRMWMEETIGNRINNNRTEEAVATGAEAICTACPYCLTMLFDGTKELQVSDNVKTYDIAELVEKAL